MPKKNYLLPEGWTIKSWCDAMQACNQAQHFIPLSKMTSEQRQAMANKYEALTSPVQPVDYDSIMNDRQPNTKK